MRIEEKIDAILKSNHDITSSNHELKSSNQELKAQNEYLQKQLGTFLKPKQKFIEESSHSASQVREQMFSHNHESSSEEEPLRRPR